MKQTAKLGCRVLVALLCLAMLASVITVPAFAAENSALTALAGQDLSAFIDLINKYNSVKDDPDAAEQLKDYVKEQYESDASFKESADEILGGESQDDTMSKFDTVIDDVLVNDEYVGDIDTVVDAIQNGATFDEIKESIEYQKENPGETKTSEVTWVVDGVVVKQENIGWMKLIPAYAGNASAGQYVKWNNEQLFAKQEKITITGTTVDIIEKIVSDVNGLPMNYGEYEMVYENGVATLYVNVDASNYKQILLDVIGDVRSGEAVSAYKEAVTSFLQASATEIYNGKVNTLTVNGYEVVAVEGYGITQLVELMETVEAGNWGEIISAAGLKNAVLVDPVTPSDVANIGDDGVLASYDVVLSAEDKADSEIEFNVALKGDIELIRKGAQAALKLIDYTVATGGDLNVDIFVPGAFTKALTKALNHANVSEQTKQTIVAGLSECATVGELLELFDLLEYDQFIEVVEYLFDNTSKLDDKEAAIAEKLEELRPAFDLFKKYGNILIEKAPESITGKEASFTVKAVYDLMQTVSFEELAALTQLKDADALVGSDVYDNAVARVANKLKVSPARAQEIVDRMVEAFADYQNRIPDSAKAQKAYDYANRAIDLIYNKIPEEYRDVKLTDTYEGNGVFSFAFDVTYNPGAWLKSVLDKVTITAYGRSITLGDYVPTRDITSDVSVTVTFADLYSVQFVDEEGNLIFKGFLPYGAELAPYYSELKGEGYSLVAVDEYGDALSTMPAADTVVTVKKVVNKYTVTFDVLGNLYTETFAYGTVPSLNAELYLFDTLNFKGWAGYGFELPAVTGDATYVAEYTADITFIVADNAYEIEVPYGATPAPEAAWIDAIADILSFKGWNQAIVPATAHATYEADLYATIRFIAGDKVIATYEVKYNEMPTAPAAPAKEMDLVNRYTFKGWYQANGTAITKATAHADYFVQYYAIPHFDADSNVTLEGSTFVISLDGYKKIGNRWTASANIPEIIFELAAMDNEVALKAVVPGNDAGADPLTVLLDNEALLNIKANATADEIVLDLSCLVGEESEWPTSVDYYDYNTVYSFDLIGSEFNGGKATITVPFKDDISKFHAYVYYVSENGTVEQVAASEGENALVFTTNHFSYYAVNYEQYLYTVNFYDLNGNLIKTVTVNTDLGQTLTDVPAFAPLADPVAEGHYVSKWKWGANKYTTNPAISFAEDPQDYDFYEVQTLVAHDFDAYELCDDEYHWIVCACGYKQKEAHNWNANGDCVCGHHKDEVTTTPDETTTPEDTTTVPGETTTPEDTTVPGEITTPEDTTVPGEITTPEDTTVPGEITTPEDTTVPGEITTPDDTTAPDESSTEDGTQPPEQSGTEDGTQPPEQSGSTDETTGPDSETESESESDTTPVDDPEPKNGWWIFLIILLVFIAILIVAYILYGHNIFPKGPATEEPAQEEELTDAQKGDATITEAPVEQEIVHVEHVSAAEADTLMTDAQAVSSVVLVACTATGKMGAVNVGTLNVHYENGDTINIDSLKEKKLIAADCKRVKILADGDLDKALTVEANSFSLQAIKMITLTGGHAIKLQPETPEDEAQDAAEVETPVEEAPVEETPVEETPVEETPVEETPAEETPAEETPAEETPAEETDAE